MSTHSYTPSQFASVCRFSSLGLVIIIIFIWNWWPFQNKLRLNVCLFCVFSLSPSLYILVKQTVVSILLNKKYVQKDTFFLHSFIFFSRFFLIFIISGMCACSTSFYFFFGLMSLYIWKWRDRVRTINIKCEQNAKIVRWNEANKTFQSSLSTIHVIFTKVRYFF